MSNHKILFAGLPSSGKTTFIAAFWYFISKATDGQSLVVESLSGDNGYINEICDKWLAYEKVSRTSLAGGKIVNMNIKNVSTGESAVLQIPDFSGEVFGNHFDSREWSTEYDKLLDEISGIVLFVNPNEEKNRPHFITFENEILRIFGEEPDVKPETPEQWQINFIPHQVKLVDALQFIEFYKKKIRPIKISVVISAWDLVESSSEGFSPSNWFGKHLPLLFQYLECNADIFKVEYFGVSAQGGDYGGKDAAELMKKKPKDRIIVREEAESSNDITKPITGLIV